MIKRHENQLILDHFLSKKQKIQTGRLSLLMANWLATAMEITHQGPFNNYVDQILPNFDPNLKVSHDNKI